MYNMYNSIPAHIHVGVYTGDSAPTDSKLFICEYHTLTDLLDGMKSPCGCGMSTHPWIIDSSVQVYTSGFHLGGGRGGHLPPLGS